MTIDYEKISKEIIAFANTNGGYIIFGIDDNGNIIFGGISSNTTMDLCLYMEEAYRRINPKDMHGGDYLPSVAMNQQKTICQN